MLKFANNAYGTLASGITSGDTTIALTAGHGARFPSLGAEDYFKATLIDASNNLEIVKVTARATDSLTVVRAQEGTTARAYIAGDRIELRWTKESAESTKQEADVALALAGTDTYTGTLAPVPTAYNTEQVYWVKFANTNTATNPTVNLNSLGAKTVKRADGSAIAVAELPTGVAVPLHYDDTNLRLVIPKPQNPALDTISGNVTLTVSDVGKVKNITATAVVTVPAASALATGDTIRFKSSTTGDVTLVRQGTDTIDGATSYRIPSYTTCELMRSGSGAFILTVRPDVNVGDTKDYAGAGTIPPDCLSLDGSNVSRSTYAGLFAVLSTTWGVGDGSTTFGLPDSRRRVAVGSGGTGTGTLGNAVGNTGGEENHALSTAELASHTHGVNDPGHAHSASTTADDIAGSGGLGLGGADPGTPYVTGSVTVNSATTGISIQNAGSGTAHNTIQPSYVVQKIIKT